MNRTRSFPFTVIGIAASFLLILLLSSCHLNFFEPVTEEATELVEATAPPVVEEVSFEPGIGSLVPWLDTSYVVYVPGGEFIMGEDEETPSDHTPAHSVAVDAFWIHQTEVTNAQYALCVAAGVCEVPFRNSGLPYWYASPRRGLDPVVGVSWEQAATYCDWIEGRLPTEAEWEKAARGMEGDAYPWGEEDPTCSLLNYAGCQEIDQPVKVRTFVDGKSPFELADTAGNVREWVQDWYQDDYYSTSPASNPTGPASGTERVIRGSSYETELADLGIYLRDSGQPSEHMADVGFRCVLTGETVDNPPPPVCEAAPYIPVNLPEDYPFEYYPPTYTVSSFCMPDPTTGISQGYVSLIFADPLEIGMYDITSSAGALLITYYPDTNAIGLAGSGIPVDTTFEIEVCSEAPDLPVLEAECPMYYYFDDETDTCRYGFPALHDTPDSCDPLWEVWVPGYGCLGGKPIDEVGILICVPGFELYSPYHSTTGEDYVICVPVDGPEECLTDPLCSASNICLYTLTYSVDLDCCELTPDIPLICPPGFTLKLSEEQLCIPPELEPLCSSFTVFIPGCGEPPPQVGCTNPETYLTPDTCVAAGCVWRDVPGTNGVCSYP
jgi:Sulfatase-modifying factor enzyme 1